jgi:hypothetical protein
VAPPSTSTPATSTAKAPVASIKVSSSISKTKSNLDLLQQQQAEKPLPELSASPTLGQNQTIHEQLPLSAAWTKMLHQLKAEKKDFLHAILPQGAPLPDDKNFFLLPVYNDAQQKELEDGKLELLTYLRNHTGIAELNFGFEMIIVADEAIKPVTANEKLGKMVEKNPNILEFVKRFDLETEY